jgi:putative peptidoglycan lipid II flippase
MSQMLKSSGAMAAATLTSRVLGMVREMVYARFMGDGWVAGAFQLAFMIPNLFRRLLGEGALTAAFIPIFKEKEKTEGTVQMWRAANAVISALVITASAVVGLVLIGVSLYLATGATSDNAQLDLMLRLLRVMFPYMLLVCLTAVFMGMLNARGHFFIPSLCAATLNLVMIASVLWLAPRFGTGLHEQIYALAIGVLVAGIAQAAFQLPTLFREGFRFEWITPRDNEVVRTVARRMIPGTLGVASYQINVLITQGIAFWVDASIVASFNYGVRLMELPQGLFGVSLATFLLPALSGLAAEKNLPKFRSTLEQGLGHMAWVNLLASVLLIVLAEPMVRLLFERGAFGPGSTTRVAFALACLSPGLVLFSAINIAARAFYALGDTRTPMQISVVCLVLNIVFTVALLFLFAPGYKQGALGVANSLSACVNVVLLLYALRRKIGRLEFGILWSSLPSLLMAALGAGVLAWLSLDLWEQHLGHATLWRKIGEVFGPASVAAGGYMILTWLLKVPSIREIIALLRNAGRGS